MYKLTIDNLKYYLLMKYYIFFHIHKYKILVNINTIKILVKQQKKYIYS